MQLKTEERYALTNAARLLDTLYTLDTEERFGFSRALNLLFNTEEFYAFNIVRELFNTYCVESAKARSYTPLNVPEITEWLYEENTRAPYYVGLFIRACRKLETLGSETEAYLKEDRT